MAFLISVVLRLLRIASHTAFFLEAQRLAAHLLRPTSRAHLLLTEADVLSCVKTPLAFSAYPLRSLTTPAFPHHPPLVLLHGHSMSSAFFKNNFDHLARTHTLHAVDLLGWGLSPRPSPPSPLSPAAALSFQLEALSSYLAHHSLTSFALLGHSLGAYVAFEYAKLHPTSVTRLILITPAAIPPSIALHRALYFFLTPQSVVRRGGLLGYLLFMLHYPKEEAYSGTHGLRDYAYHLAAQHPPSGEVAVTPFIAFTTSPDPATPPSTLPFLPLLPRAVITRPLLHSVVAAPPPKFPILLVAGETDSSMDVNDVHVLYDAMCQRGYDVDLKVISGADHCPHLEKPEQFYAAVRGFLEADVKDVGVQIADVSEQKDAAPILSVF